jgi:hypothetical protein
LALLALAALAVRAGVPAGYMLDHAQGQMIVTLCTGQGPVDVVLDANGSPLPDLPQPQDDGDETGCAFAALGRAGLVQDPLQINQPTLDVSQRLFAYISRPGQGLAAPPPPATGPPAQA